MFVDTIVGHSKIFLLDSLCFYKGIKVSFVRASRKSNFVKVIQGLIKSLRIENMVRYIESCLAKMDTGRHATNIRS